MERKTQMTDFPLFFCLFHMGNQMKLLYRIFKPVPIQGVKKIKIDVIRFSASPAVHPEFCQNPPLFSAAKPDICPPDIPYPVSVLKGDAHDFFAFSAVVGISGIHIVHSVVNGVSQHGNRRCRSITRFSSFSTVGKRMQPKPGQTHGSLFFQNCGTS